MKPETADTTGVGVVLQPSFLPGFGASVDFYNIDIKGAIVALAAQSYVRLVESFPADTLADELDEAVVLRGGRAVAAAPALRRRGRPNFEELSHPCPAASPEPRPS